MAVDSVQLPHGGAARDRPLAIAVAVGEPSQFAMARAGEEGLDEHGRGVPTLVESPRRRDGIHGPWRVVAGAN